MRPVPTDLIAFARIPSADRYRWPKQAYRVYIRGVPGGLGAGYTDIVVCKIGAQGWYLCDRVRQGALIRDRLNVYQPTREAAASEIHLAPELFPVNVREYLEEVTP